MWCPPRRCFLRDAVGARHCRCHRTCVIRRVRRSSPRCHSWYRCLRCGVILVQRTHDVCQLWALYQALRPMVRPGSCERSGHDSCGADAQLLAPQRRTHGARNVQPCPRGLNRRAALAGPGHRLPPWLRGSRPEHIIVWAPVGVLFGDGPAAPQPRRRSLCRRQPPASMWCADENCVCALD